MSEPDADLYQTIAIGHDIAMYIINDSCLDVKVADLFLLNDDLDSMHAETQGQYMLLDGISTDDLLALLNAFREQGKPFEGIVITRTKVNEVWTLSRLLEEVRREHALMETLKELDSLLEDCNGIDLSAMKTEDIFCSRTRIRISKKQERLSESCARQWSRQSGSFIERRKTWKKESA